MVKMLAKQARGLEPTEMSGEFGIPSVILVWKGGDRIHEQAGYIHMHAHHTDTPDNGKRTMHLPGPTPRIPTCTGKYT